MYFFDCTYTVGILNRWSIYLTDVFSETFLLCVQCIQHHFPKIELKTSIFHCSGQCVDILVSCVYVLVNVTMSEDLSLRIQDSTTDSSLERTGDERHSDYEKSSLIGENKAVSVIIKFFKALKLQVYTNTHTVVIHIKCSFLFESRLEKCTIVGRYRYCCTLDTLCTYQ